MRLSVAVKSAFFLCVLATVAFTASAQQNYPSKPIRIITPYAPGGSTSILSRIVGQQFTEAWGQQVLVDNRPGGNTIIGTDAAAKSAPDGYTLILTPNTHLIVPLLQATPYDAIKDFSPVATIAVTEQLLVLNNQVPASNLREFIAYAKSKPGQLNYSTGGTGTATHLAGELFGMLTGVKLQHIPYKGAGPAVVDLMGGQVQASFQSSLNVVPQIKAGKIKAVGVSGKARLSAVPQVPTFTEAGLPDFNVGFWYGILGPAGLPKPLVDRLSGELFNLVTMPGTKEKFSQLGVEPAFTPPDQFGAAMKVEMENFAKIIKTANIKLEN